MLHKLHLCPGKVQFENVENIPYLLKVTGTYCSTRSQLQRILWYIINPSEKVRGTQIERTIGQISSFTNLGKKYPEKDLRLNTFKYNYDHNKYKFTKKSNAEKAGHRPVGEA